MLLFGWGFKLQAFGFILWRSGFRVRLEQVGRFEFQGFKHLPQCRGRPGRRIWACRAECGFGLGWLGRLGLRLRCGQAQTETKPCKAHPTQSQHPRERQKPQSHGTAMSWPKGGHKLIVK